MSDSSPFDDQDNNQEEKDVEIEEDEDDDPFSNVPQAHSSSGAPQLDSYQPANDPNEETPLSLWEKERGQILRERQAKADAEKQRNLGVAKEEIDKFYADQATKLEKTKKINRADEKNYRQETAAVFANGTKMGESQ